MSALVLQVIVFKYTLRFVLAYSPIHSAYIANLILLFANTNPRSPAFSHCPSTRSSAHSCYIPIMQLSTILLCIPISYALAQSSQDSTSVSAEYANDDTFQKAVLDVTNLYRRQHNASSLAWNETLADFAKDWSEDCKFKHSGGPSGENLASGYPNVTASIEAWGNERDDYDFKKADFS